MTEITVGIVRINDDCALEDSVDKVGLHLVRVIDQGILGFAKVVKVCSVPKINDLLKEKLTKWIDIDGIKLILTLCGVTNDSSENIAVTVTNSLLDTKLPGLLKILTSLLDFDEKCFFAGIRGKSIIINLPDKLTLARRSLKLVASEVIMLTSLLFENDAPELNPSNISINTSSVDSLIQLSVSGAERKLMSFAFHLRNIKTVSLSRALGLVLAEDVKYDSEVPPFDVSSVSGYAVVSTDHSKERDVVGFCVSRQPVTNVYVVPGTCVRVEKYAGIPLRADAVIDDEFVCVVNNGRIRVEVETVTKNMNILRKDTLRGILVKGTLLITPFIGHLRDNNVLSVKVYKMPDVAVFSTFLTQRQHWLINTLKCNGFHGAYNAGIPSDVMEWFEELREAFKAADVAVTIGVLPGHCLLHVLKADFLSNVYSTGEGDSRVFFANVIEGSQRKIWIGFPKNFTTYSVEKFLLAPLFHMAHRQYAQQRISI